MSTLFETHAARLERAVETCASRGHWSPFIESPSRRLHPEGALERGKAWFESVLNEPFALSLPGERGRVGSEVSPYTMAPLGIDYPKVEVEGLYEAMKAAVPAWRDAGVEARVGVCMEILDRLSRDVFANTFATMHTAGQSFMMAFAGSGANSLDRGLEGLAYAYDAMRAIPSEALFERRFGRGEPVRLKKTYRLIPRGIAVVISCGSYPAWNAYPAILANLATANPVVVKPHPGGILPMARAVFIGREVLAAAGFDPNLLTLAADTRDEPITKALLMHRDTAIIDFTGSQGFGAWIEANCRHADVYTETAGCNSVVVESTDDFEGMLGAIAQSVCLFSSQMCTSAQNIFVPRSGIEAEGRRVSFDEFSRRLVATIDAMLGSPSHAAGICGALQTDTIGQTIDRLTGLAEAQATILRRSAPYTHPDYPDARTATPLIVQVDAAQKDLYREEYFGPMAFVIAADDRDHALERATTDARECGAIASYAYTTDPDYLARVQDAFALAGASVGCNLIRQRPINFAAAYSDFHVTGLNPAGNACLTDMAFVARRFRIVQSKVELPLEKA